MNKRTPIAAFITASLALTGSAFAANPGSQSSVDTQLQTLTANAEAQIAVMPVGPSAPMGPTGPQGPQGPTGPTGATGPVGQPATGIVSGGLSGQVLEKIDATNYNTAWAHTNPLQPRQVGDQIMGGKVIWVDETGQHGLVAALSDNQVNADYTLTFQTVNILVGAWADGIYGGLHNTISMREVSVYASQDSYAAAACFLYNVLADGVTPCPSIYPTNNSTNQSQCFAGWYLPSKFELNQIYLQKLAGVLTGFTTTEPYWSSTEASSSTAYAQDLGSGFVSTYPKTSSSYRIRCVLAF